MLKAKLNLNVFWAMFVCFLVIVGVSKLLLFIETKTKPVKEVEASILPEKVMANQLTEMIEDGYLK